MSVRFAEESISTLKEGADMLAVIGEHVELKRAGTRHRGLCPFHNEKTPSFHVEPDKGLWHCFGCNLGGDLLNFVQHIHGMDFVDAVEHLSQRTGIPVERVGDTPTTRGAPSRRRLVDALDTAAHWYQQQLLAPIGETARDYIKQRGFNRDDVDRHHIGYAPPGSNVIDHLRERGFTDTELLAADIGAAGDDGRLRDRFTGRLIFPIADHTGTIIGFGARILPADDNGTRPKYLNTSETTLYRKSKVLYGLDRARNPARTTGSLILVEGYTDVVALAKAGIDNVAATCGTAITGDHVSLLARLGIRQAVLAFDADAAGAAAAERGFAAAAGTDLDLRVLPLPAGNDPADWVTATASDDIHTAVDHAVPAGRWLIRTALAAHDLAAPEGRRNAAKAAVRIIGLIDDPVIRAEYLSYATDEGLASELLHHVANEDGIRLGSAPRVAMSTSATVAIGELSRSRTRLEADLIWVALHQPELLPDHWWDATDQDFTHPRLRQVFRAIDDAGGIGLDLDEYLSVADTGVQDTLRMLWMREAPVGIDAVMAEQATRTLLLPRIDAQIAALTAHLEGARDEYEDIMANLASLNARRRELADGR